MGRSFHDERTPCRARRSRSLIKTNGSGCLTSHVERLEKILLPGRWPARCNGPTLIHSGPRFRGCRKPHRTPCRSCKQLGLGGGCSLLSLTWSTYHSQPPPPSNGRIMRICIARRLVAAAAMSGSLVMASNAWSQTGMELLAGTWKLVSWKIDQGNGQQSIWTDPVRVDHVSPRRQYVRCDHAA